MNGANVVARAYRHPQRDRAAGVPTRKHAFVTVVKFTEFLRLGIDEADPCISLDGETDRRAGFPAFLLGIALVPDLFHRAEIGLCSQGRERVRLK